MIFVSKAGGNVMNKKPDQINWRLRDLPYEYTNDEFFPCTSGYQTCPPRHEDEMLLDSYLICCVESGGCTFRNSSLNDQKKAEEYHVGPGESFLIEPGRIASYSADVDAPWVNAWIGFAGPKAQQFIEATEFRYSPVMKTGTELYHGIRSLTDTALSFRQPVLRYMHASSVLWKMMADLITQSTLPEPKLMRSSYTERAISIIHRRYRDHTCGVSEIASELCISREYFYTLFKNDTGQSPSQYLIDLRMEKACALLMESDYPVNLIAQYVGFYDHASFSKKFREWMGEAPNQYRKQHKQ